MPQVTAVRPARRPGGRVAAFGLALCVAAGIAGCGWFRTPEARNAPPVPGGGAMPSPGQTTPAPGARVGVATDDAARARMLAARGRIDRSGGAAETRLVVVYYIDAFSDLQALQPVEVRIARTQSIARAALEALFAGAPEAGLEGTPGRPSVRGLTIRDGRAIVDLTGEVLQQRGGSAWEASVVWPIVYTLTELPGVTEVELRVEGKSQILHQLDLSRPLRRPERDGYFRIQPLIRFAG